MKKPIKNGKEVFAVLSVATVMSLSMSVKTHAASSESKIDLAAENAYTETIIDDITRRGYADFAEASQELKATDFIGLGGELEFGDEIIPAAQKAPQEPTDSNYANDEKNVGIYKETQLERGNGPVFNINQAPEMDFIDGYRFSTLEPSATSESATRWGIEMEFDRDQGQRTYTNFYFTNSGLMGAYLNPGVVSANNVGEKISEVGDFKEANYQAEAVINISGSRAQRNLNLYATVEDLEHINSIANKNTTMGWKSDYSKDARSQINKASQGDNNAFSFTVNPWPNENDMLSLITLSGSHPEKVFVQGQTITTGVSVENLDDNARERLVGQVYHPITGEVVPGAEAYIDANDKVVVKMPDGVIDENGNLNKESIFYKDPNYVAQQNLKVKFFARPRTKAEFEAVSNEANYGEGAYTPTGAGEATINHKGKDVVIDKQGIPRYDHYNLIGEFDLNLDDTRYYDQGFIDGNKKDTKSHTHSKVKPGEEFEVKLYVPKDKQDKDVFPYQKTPEEMEAAKSEKQAIGSIDTSFLDKENAGKKPEDQWKLDYDDATLPTTFKITPPKSAKAGEFVAVPLTYTYTNGSTDVHWFHFVVQESTNNVPEYSVKVNYPSEEQKSTPKLPENPDDKKLEPKRYTIPDGTEFKDDKGNEWTVSIDDTTGEVTAKPNDPSKFDGGETLTVPVLAHYEDPLKPGEDITEETKAEFVIEERANMTPRYNAKSGKSGDELSSDVILNEEDTYNRRPTKFTLDSNTYVDDKGNTWNVTIDENTGTVTATVPDGEGDKIDGALLNVPVKAHYYENDGTEIATKEVEVQFVASGTDGTKTYTEKIPFGYKVEYDQDFYTKYPEATDGYKIVTEGQAGEKKTTLTIKDSQIVDTQEEVTKQPVDALIKVGKKDFTGTFETKKTKAIEFETEYRVNNELKPGEVKEKQKGELGEEETTVTHTIVNGEVTKSEEGETKQTKDPVKRIVEVGPGTTDGTHTYTSKKPFEVEVRVNPNLPKGEYNVLQKGEEGEEEYTITIENSKVTNTSDPKETKAPVKEIIEVGDANFTGTVKYVDKDPIPFETEVTVDPSLKPGEIVEDQKGELGEQETKITRTITNGQAGEENRGETTRTKEPVTRKIRVGSNTEGKVEHKEEIPFDYKIEEVDDLKKGEYRIVKPGKVGTRTTTWTIENSKVVGEPTVTEDPAEDALIQVGKGTNDGTHDIVEKKELPFETRYEYDDSLEPGEEKIVTPGSPGEQERTNKLVIKDGKVVEVQEGEFKTTKEPQERVIKIGRKPTDGEYTKTIEREIPYETKVIYDDTLEAGFQEIENEGKPGKEEVTITQKIKDSKPVGDPTETTKTITEKEDRVVRVGVKPVEKVVELGHDTEYRHNPELKEGEKRVIEEGSKGSVKYTTTFNKETGKLEVTEERIEPTNKIVEYGTKTDGEFTYESEKAFDIKVIEDQDLEAGEVVVDQEGVVGKTKTTVKIVNSEKVSEETETLVEKQDKIVRVGTKNVCPIPGEDPDPTDPKDPTDPTDPDQPGGEDPKDPDQPGKEDPKDDEKPGHEDHERPDKPNKPNRPSYPDDNWPWTPREDDPKNPPLISHEKPKVEIEVKKDDKDSEIKEDEEVKVSENEELRETEENKALEEDQKDQKDQKDQIEETEEENNVIDNDDEREVTKKGRAPKTNDPGIALETASAGLASALLLLLRRFKRRK